jgi:hypothetical protein
MGHSHEKYPEIENLVLLSLQYDDRSLRGGGEGARAQQSNLVPVLWTDSITSLPWCASFNKAS